MKKQRAHVFGNQSSRFAVPCLLWLMILLTLPPSLLHADHYEEGEHADETGTLEVIQVDTFTGPSQRIYYLVLPTGERVSVMFDGVTPPDVRSGSTVRVRGRGHKGGLLVAAANGGGAEVVSAAVAAAMTGGQSTICI